jgi:hypothetical protein
VRKLWVIAIFLLGCKVALAQDGRPLADAGTTTCAEPQSGGGMGKWVTSKQGFSAAVELRVSVFVGTDKQRHCTTSWILHVRKRDGQPQSITVAEREDVPQDNEWIQENSFEINAWSSDGSLLLASQIEAQGDSDETTPIIYDFNSSQHSHLRLYPLFKKLIGADCYVVYRPLGFAQDGRVVISAMSTDDDREPGTKPCFGSSRWYVDFQRNTISRASPSHPKVKKP